MAAWLGRGTDPGWEETRAPPAVSEGVSGRAGFESDREAKGTLQETVGAAPQVADDSGGRGRKAGGVPGSELGVGSREGGPSLLQDCASGLWTGADFCRFQRLVSTSLLQVSC